MTISLMAMSLLTCVVVDAKKVDPGARFENMPNWQLIDHLNAQSMPATEQDFWAEFNDEYLTALINKVLDENLTLQQAKERLTQAQGIKRQLIGAQLPQVTLGANFNRTLILEGNNPGGANNLRGFGFNASSRNFTVPLVVSYEPDLFLTKNDQSKRQSQFVKATEQQLKATRLTVTTEIATLYFNLLATDAMLEREAMLLGKTLQLKQIAEQQSALGLVDDIILSQQVLPYLQSQTRMVALKEQQRMLLDVIAIMTNQPPQTLVDLPRKTLADYKTPNDWAHLEPAEVLEKRPDVLAAEDSLEAARIDVRIAKKAYLPKFSLTGQMLYGNQVIGDTFRLENIAASLAAGVLQTLFTGGQRKALLKVAKSKQQEQLSAYYLSVLNALAEVQQGYNAALADTQRYDATNEQLNQLAQQTAIKQQQLNVGLVSQQSFIPVQVNQLLLDEQVIGLKRDLLVDQLSLYKALGGASPE